VGDVGQTEHVGFSLFAYDALEAARTAVFFAGVFWFPAQPPVQLHVESSRLMVLVGEVLLHPAMVPKLVSPELDPPLPVLLLPELLVVPVPLLSPELDPLLLPPPLLLPEALLLAEPEPLLVEPEPLLVEPEPLLVEPPEPRELAPPSSDRPVEFDLLEEHARKVKRHPTPAARDTFARFMRPRSFFLRSANVCGRPLMHSLLVGSLTKTSSIRESGRCRPPTASTVRGGPGLRVHPPGPGVEFDERLPVGPEHMVIQALAVRIDDPNGQHSLVSETDGWWL
jgi:hypothetical protein